MTDDDDFPDDPDDEKRKELALAAAQALASERDRKSAYYYLVSSQFGRRFIWDVLSMCGVWRSSYGPDVAFREGQRDIGIKILADIDAIQPGIIHQMSTEFQEREALYRLVKPEEN